MTVLVSAPSTSIAPPAADDFLAQPMGWYVLTDSQRITGKPIKVNPFGQDLVVWRASDNRVIAMNARCWHMGADLSRGHIIDDQIQCPFHGWRFGATGRCQHIPAGGEIPIAARLKTFAIEEKFGRAFVFPTTAAPYPVPFFENTEPHHLIAAKPFEHTIACPWWIVGTNGFDMQHFAAAHDRRLIAAPVISTPHAAARRIVGTFEVVGDSVPDVLMRKFAGRFVTMSVTVWSGTLVFVISSVHRNAAQINPTTTTFGLSEIRPIDASHTLVRITISRRSRPHWNWLDRLDVRVRRRFIRAFLEPDARLLDGIVYRPQRLIGADQVMIEYFHWLALASRGQQTQEQV